MKKTISINIGGVIFHIEEDGYEKLKNYLNSINNYFSSFEDSKEIIEDIEGRIAEIFLNKLDDGKQIITAEDIDALIATMGTTQDFEATIEAEPETKKEAPQEEEKEGEPVGETPRQESKRLYRDEKRRIVGGVAAGLAHYFGIDPIWIRLILLALLFNVFFWGLSSFTLLSYLVLWIAVPGGQELGEDKQIKKLFRNSDDKVLGGVASGISSYFGIDPVVMRVIFVATTVLGFSGLIAYIILWIITPEAQSITEKMQMQGEPVTLSGIERNVKKSFNVKEGEESAFVKVLLFPFRLIALIFKSLGQILGPLSKGAVEILRMAVGALLVFIGSALMVGFTMALAVLIGIGDDFESLVQFGSFPAHELFKALKNVTIVSAYVVAIIPSLTFVILGLVTLLKRRVVSSYVGWSLFGIWILGLVGLIATVPGIVNDFGTEAVHREEKAFMVEDKTPTLFLNDLDAGRYNWVSLKLRGHADSGLYVVKMEFESQGRSKSNARKNAEAVDYQVKRTDGDFYFDSHLSFNDAPFRLQDVSATFFIPYGKVFKMDDQLADILRNTLWMNGYDKWDMQDNEWVFEEEKGIRCITCPTEGDDLSEKKSKTQNSSGQEMYFDYEDFKEVSMSSLIEFEIIKSNDYEIVLEGDPDLLEKVEVEKRGDELSIKNKARWDWLKSKSPQRSVKVWIRMPELAYLELSGACNGEISDFTDEEVSFDLTGASELYADIQSIYLDADLTGASKLTLKGEAKTMDLDLSGASKLHAFDLKAEEIEIDASGASHAKVYATKELEANASGASSIRYQGGAKVSTSSTGLSSVRKD